MYSLKWKIAVNVEFMDILQDVAVQKEKKNANK